MKKQNALLYIICGAVVAALCLGLIVIGIFDSIERAKYQNISINYPVFFLFVLGSVAGVASVVVGIKKRLKDR